MKKKLKRNKSKNKKQTKTCLESVFILTRDIKVKY